MNTNGTRPATTEELQNLVDTFGSPQTRRLMRPAQPHQAKRRPVRYAPSEHPRLAEGTSTTTGRTPPVSPVTVSRLTDNDRSRHLHHRNAETTGARRGADIPWTMTKGPSTDQGALIAETINNPFAWTGLLTGKNPKVRSATPMVR